MSLAPGTRLGTYEIVSLLGAGGMGEVYRSRDTKLEREVAIKVLPRRLSGDPAALARFEREAKIVAALSHPNILAIHDFGIHEGQAYAVTELLAGATLRDRLREGSLGPRKSVELACQIARGLAAAHDRGIVHRDLKPENVIISAEGTAKILDFGLAARADETPFDPAEREATLTRTNLTQPGTVLGTAGYMSPEQVRGEPADARSDIFSLGVVLYEMLTGERAFQRDTQVETMSAVLREEPVPPADASQQVSPVLWSVVRRCMEKQPRERFGSAADVGFALEAAAETSSGSGAAAIDTPASPAREKPAWLWPAAALVLAAVGWIVGETLSTEGHLAPPRPSRLRQLTFDAARQQQPTVSPDGKTVAYVQTANDGSLDIHVQRVGGANSIDLTPGDAEGIHPAFSPDGAWIAYSSPEGVFVMGATGESARRVSDTGYNPAWSPDGSRLLVNDEPINAPDSRSQHCSLWVVDVSTGERTRLSIDGQDDAVQADWSPDGRWIAFWGLPRGSGKRVLFTVPADGGRAVPLTDDAAMNWSPAWAPDGRWLYFTSNRGGRPNLWRIPVDPRTGRGEGLAEPVLVSAGAVGRFDIAADGSIVFDSSTSTVSIRRRPFDAQRGSVSDEIETILGGSRDVASGLVSPDGRWFAFASVEGTEDLFVLATDGSGLRRLTDDEFKDRGPRWTSDSRSILFFSTRSGRYEAWSIDLDGGGLRQLTVTADGVMYDPFPSPDGKTAAALVDDGLALIDLGGDLPTAERTEPAPPDQASRFFALSWSPDGKRIVGVDYDGGSQDVYVYSLADRKYTALDAQATTTIPAWLSPTRFVYSDGNAAWIADLDSGAKTRMYEHGPDIELAGIAGGFLYEVLWESSGDVWLLH